MATTFEQHVSLWRKPREERVDHFTLLCDCGSTKTRIRYIFQRFHDLDDAQKLEFECDSCGASQDIPL